MKKILKSFIVIWSVLFIVFNVISFVSVGWIGQEKYTPSFWIGYVFISITFLGQLVCAYFAFREVNLEKTFYNISIARVSYTGLILSFIFGGLCMLISPLPYWVGILVCSIFLAINVISITKAYTAADVVSDVDEKIKTKIYFINTLTEDAEGLILRAKTDEVRRECKKVYEAVRYSDPISHEALFALERDISNSFIVFTEAVKENDIEKTKEIANEIMILLDDRARKCKRLK